jgi:hypothetical protein
MCEYAPEAAGKRANCVGSSELPHIVNANAPTFRGSYYFYIQNVCMDSIGPGITGTIF